MVRESRVSGLRERHWFAQVLHKQLQRAVQQQSANKGELLALRGAVIFHLYSALLGLTRQVARGHGVKSTESLLNVDDIAQTLAGLPSPEIQLLLEALTNPADPLHWLQQQMLLACEAGGLGYRPATPVEDSLALAVEDPAAPLAEADLEHLCQAITRVQSLLQQATDHMQEW